MPGPLERPYQRVIVDWLRLALPVGSVVHHIANERIVPGDWTDRQKAAYLAGLTRDGVIFGWPDTECLITVPNQFPFPCFFETKRLKGGKLSKAQEDAHALIRGTGAPLFVVRDVPEVAAALLSIGVRLRASV